MVVDLQQSESSISQKEGEGRGDIGLGQAGEQCSAPRFYPHLMQGKPFPGLRCTPGLLL